MGKQNPDVAATSGVQPGSDAVKPPPSTRQRFWHSVQELHKQCKVALVSQSTLQSSKEGRHVPLRTSHKHPLIDERRHHAYVSNTIRSSRYTIWDFLPKQLFFQATRLHNFYFICIGVPQTIPGISTTGNYTTILPLVFFILLTVLKEAYDDYRRHRLDEAENCSFAVVLRGDSDVVDHAKRIWWSKLAPIVSRFPGLRQPPLETVEILETHEDLHWKRIQWRNIRVGDIVRVERDEPVPADIVLLHASGESGTTWIETMALDGETSLKSRQALSDLPRCDTLKNLRACQADFVLEDPNPDLYSFDGKVTTFEKTTPVTVNEVIFRGCILRNTGFVIGMVMNTGEECKIRMNANQHPHAKKPRLEKFANQAVVTLIVYVILLSGGLAVGYYLWQRSTEKGSWYIADAPVGFQQIIIGYAIMFNNVIPLALYVSLEIVKIGQMLMVNSDLEMYHETTDTPMRCNTNTILENLGQVNYVLTDKTGTLTENVMQFQKLSFAGTAWIHEIEGQSNAVHDSLEASNAGEPTKTAVTPLETSTKNAGALSRTSFSTRRTTHSAINNSNGTTAELLRLFQREPHSNLSRKARDFILGLALCHTCLPERKDGDIDFQASSPDELALVRAARDMGMLVFERSMKSITLLVADGKGGRREEIYEILDVIEFSSPRKRMSILVRRPDGRLWLVCKGADSALLPLLDQAALASKQFQEVRQSIELERQAYKKSVELSGRCSLGDRLSLDVQRAGVSRTLQTNRPVLDRAKSLDVKSYDGYLRPSLDIRPVSVDLSRFRTPTPRPVQQPLRLSSRFKDPSSVDDALVFKRCFEDLDSYAAEGLRTLVFVHRFVEREEYEAWKKTYEDAKTSLVDRQERIEAAGERIEHSFNLLGVTAIEDRLQRGVPETVDRLRRANIKIWMLTGDKRETAISIAHSARVCRPDSDLFFLDSAKGALECQMQAITEGLLAGSTHSVVVIVGQTLAEVEGDEHLRSQFYSLISSIDSVICCRASPAQKASIVRAIRAHVPSALTLAIGDGSNDIAMIQASHVGIGISGLEGLQAYRAADYSIAQFRFLARLLLCHGRWNYVRTARFILLTFWKEMFFYTMQALYQRYNGYTGTSLYEAWSLTVLNTLFTSLCVIVPGVWEKDLSSKTLMAVPELYVYGQKNMGLNIYTYLLWMIGAAASGIVVWFVCWAGFGLGLEGKQDLFALGDLVFSVAIVWTNYKLLLIETHYKTVLVFSSFLVTVAGWWAWNVLLSRAYDPNNRWPYDIRDGFTERFGANSTWWLSLLLSIVILIISDIAWFVLKRLFRIMPTLSSRLLRKADGDDISVETWQEFEQNPAVMQRLKELAEEDEID